MVPGDLGDLSLRPLPQHNTGKAGRHGGWEEGTVTALAKAQLADLPGSVARRCPLKTRLGLYLFSYLVFFKRGGGDVFSLEVGYFHSVLVSRS